MHPSKTRNENKNEIIVDLLFYKISLLEALVLDQNHTYNGNYQIYFSPALWSGDTTFIYVKLDIYQLVLIGQFVTILTSKYSDESRLRPIYDKYIFL